MKKVGGLTVVGESRCGSSGNMEKGNDELVMLFVEWGRLSRRERTRER